MTTELTNAAQQALEALRSEQSLRNGYTHSAGGRIVSTAEDAIAALERALAQRPAAQEVDERVCPLQGCRARIIAPQPTTPAHFPDAGNMVQATPEPCQSCGGEATHEAGSDETSLPGTYCDGCGPRATAAPEPSRGMLGMGAQALAGELAVALNADLRMENSLGMLGTSTMAWLRKVADEYLSKPATPEPVGEPYGTVTLVRRPGCPDQHWFYRWPDPPYLDNAAEQHLLYTHPAPGVPDDVLAILDECRNALMECDRDGDYALIDRIDALAAAQAKGGA